VARGNKLYIPLTLTLMLSTLSTTAVATEDPTRPYGWQPQVTATAGGKPQKGLELDQIIVFGERRYAIINGQRYQHHDEIRGFRIVAIENQRVRLQNGQQEVELTMYSRGIKRRSGQQGEIE